MTGEKGPGPKFLSYKKATVIASQHHVMKTEHAAEKGGEDEGGETVLVQHPIGAPFGAHDFSKDGVCYKIFGLCCGSLLSQPDSVLEPYGIGLVLYFKFLKLMSVVFLIMSIVMVPSMTFYWKGTGFSPDEKSVLLEENPANALFFTTMGSLGSGASSCMEGSYGEVFDLECKTGVFKSVEAHWGEPKGHCNCPASQQLSEQGSCQGQLTGLGNSDTPWGQCVNGPCRLSQTDLKETCCAFDFEDPLDPTSPPDLTSVNIAANPTCFSSSAQHIASGICLGNKNCTFSLQDDHVYAWDYSSKYDTVCDEAWEVGDSTTCQRKLSDKQFKSNFTSCPATGSGGNYTLIVVGTCVDEEFTLDVFDSSTTWKKESIMRFLSYLDLFCVLLFLYAMRWLKRRESKAIDESDAMNCSPSDYTIQVSNLPNCSDLAELKEKLTEHFDAVLRADAEENPKEDGGDGGEEEDGGGKGAGPEEEDLGIFEISFAVSNRKKIYWKKRRGRFARRLDKLENEVFMLNQWGKYKGRLKTKLQALHTYLTKNFDRCNERLEKLEEKVKEGNQKLTASSAFITFNTEQGYVRARKLYPNLGFLHRMTMSRKQRMANADGCRLIVNAAPEPSELIWENLGISSLSRFLRISATSLITLLLLAVSFVLIYKGRVAQEDAQRKYPNADCTGLTVSANRTLSGTLGKMQQESFLTYLTPVEVERDVSWEYFDESIGNTGKLECFCKGLLVDPDYSLTGMLGFKFNEWSNSTGVPEASEESWCKEWFTTYTYITSLKVAAVGGVIVTNVLLKLILKKLISLEGHPDKTSMIISVTIKLFLATFVNTAFLTLLINGNMELFLPDSESKTITYINDLGLLGGSFEDFDEEWYETVGVPVILTMIINMITPHISSFVQWSIKRFAQFRDRSCTSDFSFTKQVSGVVGLAGPKGLHFV